MTTNTLISLTITTFTIIVSGISILLPQKDTIKKLKSKDISLNKKIIYAILIAITITGFLARFLYLDTLPYGLNQDEAMLSVDAYALSKYGTDRFGTWLPAHLEAWGYGQMSSLLAYVMVPFIKFWGLTIFAVRLPMTIINILSAFFVYKLMKKFFHQDLAMITLTFIAINPYFFMESRWSLDCNIFPHMFIIGFYFLVLGMERIKYMYVSMIFFALCMYSYGVAFFMVPPFLFITYVYLIIKKYISWKNILISAAIYFGISFPIYGTMLINFMQWDTVTLPFTTMPYFEESVRSRDILFFSDNKLDNFIHNLRCLSNIVFYQNSILIWNSIPLFGTMYKCSVPFMLLGIGIILYKIRKKEKNSLYIPLVIYGATCLFLGISINSVNENRINIIHYCNLIFICIGIYYVVKYWKIAVLILTTLYTIQASMFFVYYFSEYQNLPNTFYGNYMEALEYAESIDCDTYYIKYAGGNKTIAEMMTMFTHQIDCKYYQGKTNEMNGKHIPYVERYIYINEIEDNIFTQKNAVYLVTEEEIHYFDLKKFTVSVYGKSLSECRYAVVVPK